jgi:hypothetical protein
VSEADSHSEHDAEHAPDEAAVEADKPDTRLIFVLVNVIIIAIVGMVIAGWQIFVSSVSAEIDKKVNQNTGGATELREVRAQEDGRLGHYQWASQKDGIVRIPVARARELVLRDWNLPPVAPTASAAPVPSTAPTAPASASAAPSTSASAAPSASAASSAPAPSASAKGS